MSRRHRGSAARKQQGSPPPRRSWFERTGGWLMPAVVVTATFLTFRPGLSGEFVTWDDDRNFLMNEAYRGLGWDNLRWMFTTFHLGPYQPLSWMSLGLDYTLYGMNPYGYHVTSLVIHVVNAWLVYVLATKLFQSAGSRDPASTSSTSALRLAATVAAAAFAIHPLRVESVSWVTERRDVLSGFFAILSLLKYTAMVDRRRRGVAWTRQLWLSIVFFALSLLAKATAMALAPALLAMDLWLFHRNESSPRNPDPVPLRVLLIEKIPFLLIGVVIAIVAAIGQQTGDLFVAIDRLGPLPRIARMFYGLTFYLWKSIWPVELSNLYEVPFRANAFDWHFIVSALIVVAISVVVWLLRRRMPALLVAWIGYTVVVLPISGVAHGGGQIVADRYSYLPCLAWALLAGGGVLWCARATRDARLRRPVRVLVGTCLAGVFVALGFASARQTRFWQDSIALWQHAFEIHPLEQLRRRGPEHADEARAYAAMLGPLGNLSAYWATTYNYGTTLRTAGRNAEAADILARGAAVNPASADLRNTWAAALIDLKRYDEAAALIEEAIRLEPGYAKAHFNLGIVRAAQGKTDDAMAAYKQAIALDPEGAEAHYNLGVLLNDAKRLDEAAGEYQRAIALRPDYAEAYNNLGVVYGRQNRVNEAIDAFRKSLAINPHNPSAERNLAQALAVQRAGR